MNTTQTSQPLALGSTEVLGHTPTLVERLRQEDTPYHRDFLHRAAADEIERLRSFIQEVADHAFEQRQDYWAAQARRVLGPNV